MKRVDMASVWALRDGDKVTADFGGGIVITGVVYSDYRGYKRMRCGGRLSEAVSVTPYTPSSDAEVTP